MAADTREIVTTCSTSARSKAPHHAPADLLHPLPIPNRPWSHIAVDFVTSLLPSEGNHKPNHTVIDKAVHFVPLAKLPSALATASLLVIRLLASWHLLRNRVGPGPPVHLPGVKGILTGPGSLSQSLLWLPHPE